MLCNSNEVCYTKGLYVLEDVLEIHYIICNPFKMQTPTSPFEPFKRQTVTRFAVSANTAFIAVWIFLFSTTRQRSL